MTMCLTIDKRLTRRFKTQYARAKSRRIPVLKAVVSVVDGELGTSFQRAVVRPGWLVAEGEVGKFDDIEAGAIHGFRATCAGRAAAKEHMDDYRDTDVLMRCWTYAKDVIALGWGGDIAVGKLYIPIAEYRKACKELGVDAMER